MSDSIWCKSVAQINWVLKYNGTIQPKDNGNG